ncbi:MAG: S8 family serine peptidase [Leptothrix sp. (in: b-proteobacteria)]
MLVLDRGFLYFAKFVAGAILLILASGAVFFGFDFNKAREDVQRMRAEIEQIAEKASKMSTEAEQKLAETERKLDEISKAAEEKSHAFQQRLQVFEASLSSTPAGGNGRSQSYSLPEIAALYEFPKSLTGAGKTIGIVELGGGYHQADMDRYFSRLHIPPPQIRVVSVDGATNQPSSMGGFVNGQVEGDIEVIGALVPKARINVYFAPNTAKGFFDAIIAATRDHVSVLSISWGSPESSWTSDGVASLNAALKRAADAGITVVVAAGDNGVTDGVTDGQRHVDFPASSPWVIAVGGTRLASADGKKISEAGWSDGIRSATGGGVSALVPLPEWQRDINVPKLRNGVRGRWLPDIAANAAPETGYRLIVNGEDVVLGGTAMATPLWASLITALNEGLPKDIGYFNPRLYREIGPAGVLSGIISGNNGVASDPGYSAEPGWNAVAGWGTPRGGRLLEWLRAHPN